MLPNVNASLGLTIFMGIAGGGLLTLVLMSTRRQQLSFSIMLALALILAVGGAISTGAAVQSTTLGVTNGVVLLVLSFALGYALTTYSVLSQGKKPPAIESPAPPPIDDLRLAAAAGRHAVIYLAPGEPPEYNVRHAAIRLALADDAPDMPPVLLRPFYMRDLKSKYATIKRSPYRDYHIELSKKVQARLEGTHSLYNAWYSDEPSLAEAVARAIHEGARHLVIAQVRVTDPPDPVLAGELLQGVDLDSYGVTAGSTEPLWNGDLLPQIYVRRVLEAVPQMDSRVEEVGLLLVGRGHPALGETAAKRYQQEDSFLRKVRRALLKVGFHESRVTTGWLRYGPSTGEALRTLIGLGCKTVYWMPASFTADGVNTLYDVPAQLEGIAREAGVKLVSLGGWNADDLAAEEIASRVRAASRLSGKLLSRVQ